MGFLISTTTQLNLPHPRFYYSLQLLQSEVYFSQEPSQPYSLYHNLVDLDKARPPFFSVTSAITVPVIAQNTKSLRGWATSSVVDWHSPLRRD